MSKAAEKPVSPMIAVMRFFEIPLATFKKEWGKLTDQDKEQLKAGVENGTLTYD